MYCVMSLAHWMYSRLETHPVVQDQVSRNQSALFSLVVHSDSPTRNRCAIAGLKKQPSTFDW